MGLFLVVATGLLAWAEDGAPEKRASNDQRGQVLALNNLTGADAIRGTMKELLANAEGTKKLLAVAVGISKEKPMPLNRNATLLLANVAEKLKDVETSITFYRLSAQLSKKILSQRGMAEAYVGLIQVLEDNKRFNESEKVCKEFLDLEGEENESVERMKPLVMRSMILAIAKQGAVDRALGMVDNLIKSDPRNWLHSALKAQVLREADKLGEASKVFLDVIDRIQKDPRLEKEDKDEYTDRYRYFLTGIFIDNGEVEKAVEQLKLLLAREPNNPTYNNDLGYIWADHGMNLAEAEKLIRKAIEEERKLKKENKIESDQDNAAYLDSLGWVLFKQGKLKEAREQLLLATGQREGQNIEIFDHLADIQMALGEKAEAIATWKKALEQVGSTKRDQKKKAEVEKKLKMAGAN
ncbi:MAG: tetratricopeptide repeat protein [Gemmataceae bacterium]